MFRVSRFILKAHACLMCVFFATDLAANGREWYVNPEIGNDDAPGTQQAPYATGQRAVAAAHPGDTIHLLPERAIYRQTIRLANVKGLVIEGHGVTLTGADPLPADGWQQVGGRLYRRRLPTRQYGNQSRQLLIVAGRAERMGRSPTAHAPFPKPKALAEGQFTWEPINEKEGWLYVCGSTENLEWSVRDNGLATTSRVRDVTVRNLNACYALNDGFNIHGDARAMHFENIAGYDNFDEGFSAHDTCECWITNGRFWGNDNAAYDINTADTYYTDCVFRDSVSVECGLQGGNHRLTNCRIEARAATAFSLTSGRVGKDRKESAARCTLDGVTIVSADGRAHKIHISQKTAPVTLEIKNSRFEHVTWQRSGNPVIEGLDFVPIP